MDAWGQYMTFLLVEETSPMKRGLKPIQKMPRALALRVEETSPMKRGLKLRLHGLVFARDPVEETSPMKRGLKHSRF